MNRIELAKRIGMEQMECDNYDICFKWKDRIINNPFMDASARFELTLQEAYETYGEENVNHFIDRCNVKHIEKHCLCEWCIQGHMSHGIRIFVGDYTNELCEVCDETENVHEIYFE